MQDQLPGTLEDVGEDVGAPMAGAEARGERAFGEPRECSSVQVTRLGDGRAFVNCVVTMETKAGRRRFQNARLFVLDATRSWRLPGWANEPAKQPPASVTPPTYPR